MIQVKHSARLSAKTIAAFGPHAKSEWAQLRSFRYQLYQNLRRLWTLYINNRPVCVIGLREYTRLGFGGEVLFYLCDTFSKHKREVLSFIRRALRRIVRVWGKLCVRVEDGFIPGHKFVVHFGFKQTMRAVDSAGNGSTLYQLRSSWLAQ